MFLRLSEREKLWREIFKCHQHKGGESIKPAFRQKGWRAEVGSGRPGKAGGCAERETLGKPCRRLLQTESPIRAEAVTEWLPSRAACIPLNASDAGMSGSCGGKWGATGMLPPMSSNITRRSSAVGHVGRHLGRGRIRSYAGCWDKRLQLGDCLCLKESEKTRGENNHIRSGWLFPSS